jgi:transmembrane sensor
MDRTYFLKILQKYREGNATQEECQFLLRYYNLFDSEPGIEELLNAKQKEELQSQMQKNIWQSIKYYEQQKKKIKPLSYRWYIKISAAALAFFIMATGIIYSVSESSKQKSSLKKVEQMELADEGLFNLPDGSTVTLDTGSTLKYPSSFDGLAKREVYLKGQAYFDIKHNPGKPFIVHTAKLKTTVLGTAFKITAWPVDENILVAVSRGKVEVADQHKSFGVIKPNEQLIYNKLKTDVIQKAEHSDNYLPPWKEQDLVLKNVTVAEAAKLLEERYNIKITCNHKSFHTKRFSTTFVKGETLEQVLLSICEFNNAVYHYDKEKASVKIIKK